MASVNNNSKTSMSAVMQRNINALLEHSKKEETKKTKQEKIADAITKFTGSMTFVYLHVIIFGVWILWNTGLLYLKAFDPSLVVLAMVASVEAIFLSTFVLISQNSMSRKANKRAELDLQVTLLAEHEITQIAGIVKAIADKLNVSIPEEVDVDEILKDVKPERVIDEMDASKNS